MKYDPTTHPKWTDLDEKRQQSVIRLLTSVETDNYAQFLGTPPPGADAALINMVVQNALDAQAAFPS